MIDVSDIPALKGVAAQDLVGDLLGQGPPAGESGPSHLTLYEVLVLAKNPDHRKIQGEHPRELYPTGLLAHAETQASSTSSRG